LFAFSFALIVCLFLLLIFVFMNIFACVIVPQILCEHPFIELVNLVRRHEITIFTYEHDVRKKMNPVQKWKEHKMNHTVSLKIHSKKKQKDKNV